LTKKKKQLFRKKNFFPQKKLFVKKYYSPPPPPTCLHPWVVLMHMHSCIITLTCIYVCVKQDVLLPIISQHKQQQGKFPSKKKSPAKQPYAVHTVQLMRYKLHESFTMV